jgi:signal transduction histidine kinase
MSTAAGAEARRSFREETRLRNWSSLRLAAFFAWFFEPGFWLLDRIVIEGEDATTLSVRVILLAFALGMQVIAWVKPARLWRYDYVLSMSLALSVAWGVEFLMLIHDGYESEYFAGIMFVLIAVGFLFSWSLRAVLVFYGLVFIPYLAPLVFGWLRVKDVPFVVSQFVFLFTTVFISGLSQVFRYRLEEREFYGRQDLERTKAELQDAFNKLKEMDKLKSQFFSNITHELRTPLTMILSPMETLLSSSGGPRGGGEVAILKSMWRNGLKLLKLINDLLDLAKLAERFLRLNLRKTDLGADLAELIEHAQPLAARKSIELKLEVVEPPRGLLLDPEKMERVYVNLLSNALKFTPEGGEVRVRLWVQDGAACISIEDTGIGIAADKIGAIFDRFTQAEGDVARRFGGTGIGLAFAKEIVELHGGVIGVKSRPGEGSTFTVRLTLGDEHFDQNLIERRKRGGGTESGLRRADDQEPKEWARQLRERTDYRFMDLDMATERRIVAERDDAGKDTKVLVVEDNPDIIRFVSALLSQEHAVYTACNGRDGLELALREKPDLIVSDYMMPEMDGLSMVAALRKEEATADTPIIMLTAKAEVHDRLEARQKGADVYLSKPFNPDELLAAVRRELVKRGRAVGHVIKAQTQSLEVLSASLAHEIHNPLAYIHGGARLMGETLEKAKAAIADATLSDEEREQRLARLGDRMGRLHDTLDKGVRRIQAVVDLLRRYAREGYPDEPTRIAIDDNVKEVAALVAPKEAGAITIDLGLNAPGVVVRAIPQELNQALGNVIQNAFDAMEGRSGTVLVKSEVEGAVWLLRVQDQGGGIPKELRARIFTPFFTTKDVGKGMGMGLAITQQVMRNHGGSVEVASVDGEGATVTLRLPIARAD